MDTYISFEGAVIQGFCVVFFKQLQPTWHIAESLIPFFVWKLFDIGGY